MMPQHIVALGGGGFSMEPDNLALDKYILDLTGKDRPKVCFLPQASAEAPSYVLRFYEAFVELDAKPSWLSLYNPVALDFANKLLEQDVIYVGGGNTKTMLAIWREWGVDKILKQAIENGTVLAGISAGAICWFEDCVTDSVKPLGTIKGLGFLEGCASPHYHGEADRRPKIFNLVQTGAMESCLAIDDSTAVHFIDGKMHQVVTSQKGVGAFDVRLKNSEISETEYDKVLLAPVP